MAAGGGGWGGIMADVPVFEVPDEPGAAAGNAAGGGADDGWGAAAAAAGGAAGGGVGGGGAGGGWGAPGGGVPGGGGVGGGGAGGGAGAGAGGGGAAMFPGLQPLSSAVPLEPGTANGRALDTTRRRGAREREPGPGSSPARANGAPRVGQGPPDVP